MANFVDIANESVAVGIDPGTLSAAMGAVPVPSDLLTKLGLRVTADNNVIVANNVRRTVRLAFGPSASARIAAVSINADGGIQTPIISVRGLDWILPPIVTVDPGVLPPGGELPLKKAQLQAFLRVAQVNVPEGGGGAGYPNPGTVVHFIGGLPPAQTKIVSGSVRRIAMIKPGLGYAPGTVCVISGGGPGGSSPPRQATANCVVDAFGRITSVVLTDMGAGYVETPVVDFIPPGGLQPKKLAKAGVAMSEGTPARAHVTVTGGVITGVVMDDPGIGYIGVPQVVIDGPPGVGAVATARMELDRIDVRSPGLGYTSAASFVVTPVFKNVFPDGSDQSAPFFRFMEHAIQRGALTPVFSYPPVLS